MEVLFLLYVFRIMGEKVVDLFGQSFVFHNLVLSQGCMYVDSGIALVPCMS